MNREQFDPIEGVQDPVAMTNFRLMAKVTRSLWTAVTFALNAVASIIPPAILGGGRVYDIRAFSSLDHALAVIAAQTATLYITQETAVTANAVIPATLDIAVLKGGSFAISSGVTLTINGPFSAGRHSVFTGDGSALFGLSLTVFPEWFGAVSDGSTDDGGAINRAINSLQNVGGVVQLCAGETYAVAVGSSTIRLRSNIRLAVNSATIQRTGSNYTLNLIENFSYSSTTRDHDIEIVGPGYIYGNGTNDTATQSHESPAGNIFFFGVDRFLIRGIKFNASNGDNFGWRLSNYGWVDGCIGGTFGRNLFSPTSGIGNMVTNCNLLFRGLTGASPGEYIDAESDGGTGFSEESEVSYVNVQTYGVTLLDPFSDPDNEYALLTATLSANFVVGDVGKTILGGTSGATAVNIAYDNALGLVQVRYLTGTHFTDGETFTTVTGTGAGTITDIEDKDQSFSHEATFTACHIVGNSPQTFRIRSANHTVAKRIIVDDTCVIGVETNTAAAVNLRNISGPTINATLVNTDPAGQGSSKAIWVSGNVYAQNASSGGIFYIAGISGYSVMSKTVAITNTVAAGSETVTWGTNTLVIAVQAGVSTVAQVLAATPTGTAWGTLSLHTAGTVAALSATAMSALPGWTQDYVSDFTFGGRIATDQFGSAVNAIDCPIKNSTFGVGYLGDINLHEGSDDNRFVCEVNNVTLQESTGNKFEGDILTSLTLNSAPSNDFVGDVADLDMDNALTINNRFRGQVTGALTLTNGATWIGQYFEQWEGSFSPTITGSGSGSATVSASWGRYNLLGDIIQWSMSVTWTASTGVGDQRINLNIQPDGATSVTPAGTSPTSRWAVSHAASGFAFTGSYLQAYMSGGSGFVSLIGVDNAGTQTAVPASTAAGTAYLSGFFRVR